jgi:hypothetical protein
MRPSLPTVILPLLLICGCSKRGLDGEWQCEQKVEKELDLHKIVVPYAVKEI